ncbi:hypothetical protein FRC03_005951 [Tulasnella sp. 419]|nr:hypothetical protein FRC03_005951 [Tulasnella sp. 419]
MQWFSTILSQTGSFLTRNQLPRFDDLDDLEQDNSADNGDSPSEHLSFAISQSHFPIDKLFTELLCMIFAFCCEVEYPEAPPLAEKRDDKIDLIQSCSPLTLVHVSQRWREAGMRLKPMWTFIRVTDSTPLSKICFWLDRSGSHPLNTLIEDVHPNRLLAAYHLLVPHAKRWCEFRILAGETCLAGPRDRQWHLVPFLERRKEHNAVSLISAPILSVLHLQKRLSFILLMDQTTNYPSLSTSMLQKLTITRLNLDWNHLRHHMALSGITELEVDQSFHQA